MATNIYYPYAIFNGKVKNYRPSDSMDILEDEADMTQYSKRRLRSTKPTTIHDFEMIFSAVATDGISEFSQFRNWILSNLAGGVNSFYFRHPLTNEWVEMLFILQDGAAYTIERYTANSSVKIRVQMKEV